MLSYSAASLILSLGVIGVSEASMVDDSINTSGQSANYSKNDSESHSESHSENPEHSEHDAPKADVDEHEHEHEEEMETIVIQATRSGRIADEQPIRVEVINREEIEEKAAMRPGNISMLVAETGGVRLQCQYSPTRLVWSLYPITGRWFAALR